MIKVFKENLNNFGYYEKKEREIESLPNIALVIDKNIKKIASSVRSTYDMNEKYSISFLNKTFIYKKCDVNIILSPLTEREIKKFWYYFQNPIKLIL